MGNRLLGRRIFSLIQTNPSRNCQEAPWPFLNTLDPEACLTP